MTTLWIDNNLVLRHSEKGWPEYFVSKMYPEGDTLERYEKAIAQAKADSLPFEDHNAVLKLVYANKDKNGISILTSMYADTFIEIAGEVIVGYQVKTYGGWADVSKDNYESTDEEYRKVARLKPAKEPIRADLTEQQMDDHIEALTAPFPTEEKLIQMSRCGQDMHKENEQLHAQIAALQEENRNQFKHLQSKHDKIAAAEKRVKELETKLRLSETLSQGYRNQKSSLGADLAALNVKYEIAEYALRDIDMLYDVADPPYTPKKLADIARIALKKIGKYEDTETK